MRPYIHYCQDCDAEIEVEIESFTPDEPMIWAPLWENSHPGSAGEVWYKLPDCPECKAPQEDSNKIYDKIFNYCLDYYADGDF